MRKIFLLILTAFLSSGITFAAESKAADAPKVEVKTEQKTEQQSIKQEVKTPRDYSAISVMTPVKGIYIFKIDTKNLKGKIVPYYEVHLKTNREVYDCTKALLVVNAGFFDPSNEQTVSYVTKDYAECLDPHRNNNLIQNEALKPYLPKIFNRSEFRVLEKNGEYKYDIAQHNDKPETGYHIKHSIQAGPMLLPSAKLEEEFFILKKDGKIVSESASALKPYARTAIGIKNNNIYILIFTTEHPATLEEVAKFGECMELEKLMAFDGGGSTSIDTDDLHIISDKNDTGRRLKSFLLITE